jgi:predicted MFS family arabinose efflux permease
VQGADLAGQPLGGVLFELGRAVPFFADAASYAISFGSLLFVRTAFQEERARSQTHLVREVAEGLAWLWRQPFLRAAIILVAGSNFAFAGLTLVLIVRAKNLGASPSLIGAMFAFMGGGALVGSAFAPWVQRHVSARLVILGSLWFWAMTTASLAALPQPIALGAVSGLAAVFGPIFNVVVGSYRYALVPDRLLARVQSAALVVAWGMTPLGSLAAGLLLEAIGAVTSLLVLAAVSGAVAVCATLVPAVRRAPEIEDLFTARAT